ncbi:hypothetical protein GCM10027217_30710 [Pseudomaricurvus hydrocarbonicus]
MCLFIFSSAIAHSATILVPDDVMSDYQTFVDGRDVGRIFHFDGKASRRDVVEVVLVIQALLEGGYKDQIRLRSSPDYARTFRELAAGNASLGGTTVWKRDAERLKPSVAVSDAIVRPGEFMVGVYTCKEELLSQNTLPALKDLRVVSNRQWTVDWQTLQAMGFSKLDSVDNWISMVKMLCLGRADITLAPFPAGKQLSIEVAEYRLYPIEGIQVELLGSRHYPISRTSKDYAVVSRALTRGLRILRRERRLERAYRESGFFNAVVEDWSVVNHVLSKERGASGAPPTP